MVGEAKVWNGSPMLIIWVIIFNMWVGDGVKGQGFYFYKLILSSLECGNDTENMLDGLDDVCCFNFSGCWWRGLIDCMFHFFR